MAWWMEALTVETQGHDFKPQNTVKVRVSQSIVSLRGHGKQPQEDA